MPGRLVTMVLMLVELAMRIVRWPVLLVTGVLAAALLIGNFPSARRFYPPASAAVTQAHAVIMNTLGAPVRRAIPASLAGRDRPEWVLIALALLINAAAGRVGGAARRAIFHRHRDAEMANFFAETGLSQDSRIGEDLERRVKALSSGGKSDRQELLRVFAETKRKLDGMGRELAFLAVDVVGSTAMKEREDPATVQIDFAEYRKLVESVFNANGVIKAAWTPDGVMACFSDLDRAVSAGKGVVRALEGFNRDVKLMKSPFAVRCGVNAGFVYLDDDMPLERVSDRVIDIAGHMQKYAEPNTVAVAKSVVKPMGDVDGFEPTDKVVDGHEVYSWRPQVTH